MVVTFKYRFIPLQVLQPSIPVHIAQFATVVPVTFQDLNGWCNTSLLKSIISIMFPLFLCFILMLKSANKKKKEKKKKIYSVLPSFFKKVVEIAEL